MNKHCWACGKKTTQEDFCEFCGSPLKKEDDAQNLKPKPLPEFALGYYSFSSQEHENKDSFLLLDATSLFSQENHRRILCVMVKGLSKVIDGKSILNKIIAQIAWEKSNVNYQACLAEINNYLERQDPFAFSKAQGKDETGLLVSVLDNEKVTSMCIDGPKIMLIKANETLQTFKGTKTEPFQNLTLEKNDCLCMSNVDVACLLGQKETLLKITKAANPQAACEDIASAISAKKPELDLSIGIAQRLE